MIRRGRRREEFDVLRGDLFFFFSRPRKCSANVYFAHKKKFCLVLFCFSLVARAKSERRFPGWGLRILVSRTSPAKVKTGFEAAEDDGCSVDPQEPCFLFIPVFLRIIASDVVPHQTSSLRLFSVPVVMRWSLLTSCLKRARTVIYCT